MKPRPVHPISTLLTAATLIAISLATFTAPGAAHAELPGSALDSPIARYLLLETLQGTELASRLLGREVLSFPELRNALETSALQPARASLEARLSRIREDFYRARVARANGREVPESAEYTAEERTLLAEIAARDLRMNAAWRRPGDPRPGYVEFVAPSSETGVAEELLAPEADFTRAGRVPSDQIPAPARKKLWERATEPFQKMQACVRNEPPGVARRGEITATIKQTLINEGLTVGATYFAAGEQKVDKKNLSGDMLMTLFSSIVGGSILKTSDTFLVRWNKTAQFGVGRAQVDTAYYYITPWKTVPDGYDVNAAARERLEFNTGWNLATSITSPTIFTLTSGMECLYRGTKWESAVGAGTFLFRTAVSGVNAVIYYEARGKFIGHDSH